MTDTQADGRPVDAEDGAEAGAERLRAEFVEGLVGDGVLSPVWRPAFEAVARHEFLPQRVWRHVENGEDGADLLPLDRGRDPAGWLANAYADASVITQVDDGHPGPDGRGREVSSSASTPSVVARMLTALQACPGMRVLEIGTGTGWNAALLAHRLGAGAVTTVEIDPVVAAHARVRLSRHGVGAVTTVVGDGEVGWPEGAPYDRVLATVGAQRVPYAWVEQTRPGGLVVLPWGSAFYNAALLRLEVGTGPDGPEGQGRIVGNANFMLLRSQRGPRRSVADAHAAHPHAAVSQTELHPYYLGTEPDAATAIGLRLPGVQTLIPDDHSFYAVDRATNSWALVDTSGGEGPWEVAQAGPRRLHDELLAAYQWWRELGEPAVGDWLVSIDHAGQRVRLRPPGSPAAPAPAPAADRRHETDYVQVPPETVPEPISRQ